MALEKAAYEKDEPGVSFGRTTFYSGFGGAIGLQCKDDRPTLDIIQAEVCIYPRADELNDPTHLIQRIKDIVTSLERKNEEAEERARASMRQAIFSILNLRGVICSDAFRHTVEVCMDIDSLETWQMRALTVKTEGEVFGESQ